MRYHAEDIERNQYRGNDPRIQSQSFAEQFGSHREQIDIDTKAWSYYAQNTFHIGNWSLTPGVRVEDYTIKTDVIRADGDPQNNPESKLKNSQTVVLPGIGAAWNGIANTTVFAGVHKGFSPPRPDRDIRADGEDSAVVDKTKAEESTNWEIGVRSNYFKGIGFEATLFHTDFDEIVINNGAGTFINGGESQMSGLELAGRVDFGRIYNTNHNIYVMGSYTNLFNAEFRKNGLDPDNGIIKGDRLPYAPRHLASLSVGFQHPTGFDARIGVDYVSSQEPDAFARVLDPVDAELSGLSGKIPSYTLLNASIRYAPKGSRTSYFLTAHNLNNKEYLATRVDGMAAGRSRQVFGGVKYEF
jgi:Fe(3+) dicitrate transport protein